MTAHLTSRRIRDLPFPSYPVVFFYARARSDTKKKTRSTERCTKIADPPSEETDITLPPSPLSSSQITQRDRKNEPTNHHNSRQIKLQQATTRHKTKRSQARHTSKTQARHKDTDTQTQTTTSTRISSLPKQE